VTVVDGHGNPVPNAADRIMVTVEGAGTLLGIENGDQADNTDYALPVRCAYRGKLLVYVRAARQPGSIRVICRSFGSLREAVVELEAR
jgi:beta-galactosidase